MTPVTPTQIQLAIPGAPDFMRLARLAAADAGSRVGMTFEDLEDLRIAVDELGFTVTGGRPECVLNLVFTLRESAIEIEGRVTNPGDSSEMSEPSELARTIVAAVVDEY